MPGRDVGELGEDDFKRWCTACGMSAIKAVPDRMGWDFFVEFEATANEAVPLDRRSDLRKALVQVKATDAPSQTVRAKLSALKHLVDADLPAFIAHIDYSGQLAPRRMRLLHIGPAQIAAILRRVRQAEKKGRFDLHNIKMSLPLQEAAMIEDNGTNLRDLLLAVMPASGADYVGAKTRFRKSCGYDERSIKAHFTLAPEHSQEALVDLMIGKVPHLPVREMIVDRARFGISLDKDIDRLGEGYLSVEVKPFQRGRVTAMSSSRRRIDMTVDLYAPNIPKLSPRLRKIRIANQFLEMVANFGQSSDPIQVNLAIEPEAQHSIDVLANVLGFGVVLSEDESEIEFELGSSSPFSLRIPPEMKRTGHWRVLHEFTEFLAVALFRHRRGVSYTTTIQEMERALDENENMFALLTRPGLSMTFGPDADGPESIPREGVIYCPACIQFGPFAYTAIVKINVGPIVVSEDGAIEIVGLRPEIIEDNVVERNRLRIVDLNARAVQLGRLDNGKDRFVITPALSDAERSEMIVEQMNIRDGTA